ncbi:hypothetical protein [Bacillus cereus]|uniref:hypothetical protein n=1 Tax=Bacillus cereus TaxID=1396 RepID=UPI000B4A7957|nr:hypothetical protein [Bacillus cereus]
MKVNKLSVVLSILIPIVLTMLIINFVFELIPTTIQGLPMFLPLIFCPIGIILAYIDSKSGKSIWSRLGFILNSVLFFVPIIWMVGGTVFFGV